MGLSDSKKPRQQMCTEPQCNLPAVRVGPYERRPLCRRHLLAACRERDRRQTDTAAADSMQLELVLFSQQQKKRKAQDEQEQTELHEQQQTELHEQQQTELHEQQLTQSHFQPAQQKEQPALPVTEIPPSLICRAPVAEPLPKVPSRSASCAIPFECLVQWVTCCNATDGYFGDASGRVVHSDSIADPAWTALPRIAIYAALQSKGIDHLVVTSLDGSGRRLRCHCQSVNLSKQLCGLLCQDQRLFFAQPFGVAVTDLSGQSVLWAPAGNMFDSEKSVVRGIFSTPGLLFVTDGNQVVSFTISDWKVKLRADLSSLLGEQEQQPNSAVFHSTIVSPLVLINQSCTQVLSLCQHTGRPLGIYPRRTTSGFEAFKRATCADVDSRGHLFVSDSGRNAVYAIGGDGTLLRIYGRADPLSSLLNPRGLTVAKTHRGGAAGDAEGDTECEKLVVADWGHKRLLVFDL